MSRNEIPQAKTEKLTLLASSCVMLIGCLGLFGWLSGNLQISSLEPYYVPMAQSTGVCFLLLGFVLLIGSISIPGRFVGCIAMVFSVAVLLFGALVVIGFYFGTCLTLEDRLLVQHSPFGEIPLNMMSPLTGALFFFSALSMLLNQYHTSQQVQERDKSTLRISVLLSLWTFFVGFTILLGYVYGTPFMYGGPLIPVAPATALGFFFLGMAIASSLDKEAPLIAYFRGGSTASLLVRRFVPLVVAALIVQGLAYRVIPHLWDVNNALLSAFLAGGFTILFVTLSFHWGTQIGKRIDDAETKLRESEQRFVLAMEAAEEGLWDWDIPTGEFYYSSGWSRILGYSVSEVESRYDFWESRIHPEDRQSTFEMLHNQLSGRLPVFMSEHRLLTKEGKWKWVLAKGRVVDRQADGSAKRIVGTTIDITNQKKAQELLQQERDLAQKYLDIAGAMLVGIDLAGSVTLLNKKGCEILECKGEEVIGLNWFATFLPERTRDAVHETFQEIINGKIDAYKKVDGDIVRTASGSERLISWHHSVLRDQHGKIVGTLSSGEDITERRHAEEVLFQTKSDWEDSFNSIDDMITIHDSELNIIQHNMAAKQILGLPNVVPQDRMKCFQYYHGKDGPPEACPSCQCLQTKEPTAAEMFEPHLNMFLEIRAIPRFDRRGQLTGLVHIVRDITARKKAEEEKANLELQLLQAQKMEAIGTLAGGVAHDFNNVLQVVLGYSDLLLTNKNPDDHDFTSLQKVRASARRGADLVKRLLTFGRKGESNPRPLNLNHEVTQVKELLERTIPKMISIELHLEDELLIINADSVHIEQILMNLAINAKDAMPEEGGKLTIETKNVILDDEYCSRHMGSKAGPHVMLSVSDTGSGMTQETLEHIFEPFFTTKAAGIGTGLGLSTVYGIVKQHGGYITCESVPDQGTTFRIYFPVVLTEVKEHLEQDSSAVAVGYETILLVDDEQAILDIGAEGLRGAGYIVLTAISGLEAVEIYKNRGAEVSLVILDLIMPEMGGIQCYQELIRINPDVRVVISSGLISDDTEKDAEQLGAKGFVQKPYDGKKLLKAVRDVLDAD